MTPNFMIGQLMPQNTVSTTSKTRSRRDREVVMPGHFSRDADVLNGSNKPRFSWAVAVAFALVVRVYRDGGFDVLPLLD
jgi:hypothetical protein